MASLKQEFLIVHQYIVNILNELDDDQQLADPEVRDCFTKFNKVSVFIGTLHPTEILFSVNLGDISARL